MIVTRARYNRLSDYSDNQQLAIDSLRKENARKEREINLLWDYINRDNNKPQPRTKTGQWTKSVSEF